MGRTLSMSLGLFLALCLGVVDVAAQGNRENPRFRWSAWDLPNSMSQSGFASCGRSNVSSVCDPYGLIQPTQADALDDLIKDVYRTTECTCDECKRRNSGYIIRVAIIPRMERLYTHGRNTSYARLREAMMFSYILSTRWHMDGLCNETALILFSKHDDILFTLTRQGARESLTDNDVTTISVAVRHYFDNEETIADGLMEMIRRYRLVFNNQLNEAFLPSSG